MGDLVMSDDESDSSSSGDDDENEAKDRGRLGQDVSLPVTDLVAGTATKDTANTVTLFILQEDEDDQQHGCNRKNAQQQYIQQAHFNNLPEGKIKDRRTDPPVFVSTMLETVGTPTASHRPDCIIYQILRLL